MNAALTVSSRKSSMSAHSGRRAIDASLFTSLVLVSIGSGLFLPLSLVFFVELTNIRLGVLGVLVGLAGFVSVPVPAIAGRLADRYGARRLVVVAPGIQAIAYLGYVFARDPLSVFAVTAVMSIGGRLFWSTIFATLADHAEDGPRQQHWFALANIARTAGIATGGIITGIALTIPGTRVYVVLALLAAGCLAAAVLLILPIARSQQARRHAAATHTQGTVLRDGRFLGLLATNIVFAIATFLLGLAVPVVVKEALDGPGWLSSAVLVGNALFISSFGVFGARQAARREPFTVLRIAAVAWAAGCALLAGAALSTLPLATAILAGAAFAFSFAEILHAPTSVAIASSMAPDAKRGDYLAVWQYSFMAAEIGGPILFGTLFTLHHSAPFLVVLALNLAVIPALWGLGRSRRSTAPDASTPRSTTTRDSPTPKRYRTRKRSRP
ncbi:MFS transporter [Micromonospora arida]|uniref:MFS transporter n=1 Tax=Micromonospora arida TaxID=2203715 RepID=UPI0033A2C876